MKYNNRNNNSNFININIIIQFLNNYTKYIIFIKFNNNNYFIKYTNDINNFIKYNNNSNNNCKI